MLFTNQSITSKNTSVNTTKLPQIYSLIDWPELKKAYPNFTRPIVFDYGCGKSTDHIKHFLRLMGFQYVGYDPYWKTEEENERALNNGFDIIICSNVLNVIKEKEVINEIHDWIRKKSGQMYFIKVYEGDKSCVNQISKKDCFQRNEPTENYIRYCTEGIRKKVITHSANLRYIL